MGQETLGQVAYEVWAKTKSIGSAPPWWDDIAQAVIAEYERRRWNKWPDETDDGEYPPDETDVLIYCGNWASKDYVIGRISKRGGTYGPSGASHWAELPAPPEATNDPA